VNILFLEYLYYMKLMNVLSEIESVKTIKDVNWYGLISSARKTWSHELSNNVKIPNKFYDYITSLLVSFTSNMKETFESDVMRGNLSKDTLDLFNSNVLSSLNKISKDPILNSEIQNIPPYQRKLAKTVGVGKIKNGVDRVVQLTGQKFFKEGFTTPLKSYYSTNSPIVQNYIKVSNQMGDHISNNQQLKTQLYNFILNKL